MIGTRTGIVILLSVSILAACGQEDAGADSDTAPELQALADSLRQEFPRLREEPLPPPQPSAGADPSEVPARLVKGLPAPVLERVTGEATFYADQFEGRRTASGIPFRQNQMVAAHRLYPFGTILRVTNRANQRAVNVRVIDRGPFGAAQRRGGILDLSRRAAEQLGYVGAGRAQVQVEVLEWGSGIET